MKKLFLVLIASVLLAGCQPKSQENAGTAGVADEQRKEASRKLTIQAMGLLGQKDFQGAVSSLDAAIKFDPSNQDPYLILGQLLLKSGENERAAEFLDNAVKNFPENGTLFYMLAVANKMNEKKLPAVLAARRSFEIFKNANDQENAQKAAILLQQIVGTADAAEKK
jgi:predicted Zn-dependent protease